MQDKHNDAPDTTKQNDAPDTTKHNEGEKDSERLTVLRDCRLMLRKARLVDEAGKPVGCPENHVLVAGLDELLAGEMDWEEKRSLIIGLVRDVRRLQAQYDEQHRLFDRVLTLLEQRRH